MNIAEREAARHGAIPVVADIRQALRALAPVARAAGVAVVATHRARVQAVMDHWHGHLRHRDGTWRSGGPDEPGRADRHPDRFAEAGDIVVAASGTLPTDLLRAWDPSGGLECYVEFGTRAWPTRPLPASDFGWHARRARSSSCSATARS